jgi:hypothetical protein
VPEGGVAARKAGTDTNVSTAIDAMMAKRNAKEYLPAFMNQPPCGMRSFG